MKASEILADARARVDQGWCKGRALDGEGNVCAVGAITMAEYDAGITSPFGRHRLGLPPYAALMNAVKEFGDFDSVPNFNDDPMTSKQDVLNAFDKAIGVLEEQGL